MITIITIHMGRQDLLEKQIRYMETIDSQDKFVHLIMNKGDIPEDVGRSLIINTTKPFSKGVYLNDAISSIKTDKFFVIDCDTLPPINLIELCDSGIKEGQCYFPMINDLPEDFEFEKYLEKKMSKKEILDNTGIFRNEGYGNFGMTKIDFGSTGKFIENKAWGGEDSNMFLKCKHSRFKIERPRNVGFFHMYHQRDKPFLNKNYNN